MEILNQSPQKNYNRLRNLVFRRFFLTIVFLGLIFFLPAGSLLYWEAWIYCGILLIPMLFVLIYLLRKNPGLLERRMRMREKEKPQKALAKLNLLIFLAAFIIPGLDHRFQWSSVPLEVIIVADVFIFLGYMFFVWVLKTNAYASRIIEVESGQTVITTGPYAFVRHPLYLAATVMFLFSPIALGSWWALLAISPFPVSLVLRILNEEKVLEKQLQGYKEYERKVKYRLIPYIW